MLKDTRDPMRRGLSRVWCVAKWNRIVVAAAIVISAATRASGADQVIDTDRSTITIHVFKSGVFRAFADNHEIQALIKEGSVDEGKNPGVKLVVDAGRMRVLDPGLSPKDRNEVQTRMLGGEVLDVDRFPQMRFESTTVDRLDPDGWMVRGQLTLHGQSRSVVLKVSGAQGHYKGSTSLKQSDFGITPISIAGGTVKVKDEVRIEFDVWTRATPTCRTLAKRDDKKLSSWTHARRRSV